jgi:hypothetical protein
MGRLPVLVGCPWHCNSGNANTLVIGLPFSALLVVIFPKHAHFLVWSKETPQNDPSMDDRGSDHVPEYPRNSFHTPAIHQVGYPFPYRLRGSLFAQEPLFSSSIQYENHPDLRSLYVGLSPRLLSLPGDQNRGIIPVMARTIYHGPSIDPHLHSTIPYTTSVPHVDPPYPFFLPALPYMNPQQMASDHFYTQVHPVIRDQAPYELQGRHDTQAYHGLSGQYDNQVKCRVRSDLHRAVHGPHWLSHRTKDGSGIL